jgi:transcriptional regulator with XRE-family HTH domain
MPVSIKERRAVQRFGEKLRVLRTRNNMTHAELAAALGYSSSNQISHLENGRRNPTAELIFKVSKLFTVSADVLLDDELELNGVVPYYNGNGNGQH